MRGFSIRTRHLRPKGRKPARVRAEARGICDSTPWDHGLSEEGNHDAAARMLLQQVNSVSQEQVHKLHRGEAVDPLERVYVPCSESNEVTL